MAGVAISSSEIGQADRMVKAVNKLRGLGMSDGAMVALVDIFYGAITNGYDNFIQILDSSRSKQETSEPDYSPKKYSFTTESIEAVEDTGFKTPDILVKEANTATAPQRIEAKAPENIRVQTASQLTETDSLEDRDRLKRFGGNWLALKESGVPGPGAVLEIKPPVEKRKRGRPRKVRDPVQAPMAKDSAVIVSAYLKKIEKPADIVNADKKDLGLLQTPLVMKICSKCNHKKPLTEYHLKNPQKPQFGHRDECKACDVKAVVLADDEEARRYLKSLSTLIPKGFPVGKPERFDHDHLWNLVAISELIVGNEGKAAKNLTRLATWGYIGRKFINRKRGYTYWITDLGMNAIKKLEAIGGEAILEGLCEAVEPDKAATV